MMKKSYLSLIIITLLILNMYLIYIPENKVQGTNISGEYSGYLTPAGSPYVITDNLTVTFQGFLDIRPGVELRFNPGAILYIQGDPRSVIIPLDQITAIYEVDEV